ncbi:MAG TPA: transcriptional repressor, partial [Thermoanaerobaculia bacterium]|nr:transcriptional repressor [Thermoanaerobaculia bacterium]
MKTAASTVTLARRKTQQQRLVYETVAGTESHPTAEWVYRQVRRRLPRISLGTVYRNLQRLVGEGKLKSWSR